jgi:hypothetical protein
LFEESQRATRTDSSSSVVNSDGLSRSFASGADSNTAADRALDSWFDMVNFTFTTTDFSLDSFSAGFDEAEVTHFSDVEIGRRMDDDA